MFEIYFNDLNEDCKERLMVNLNISTPEEANLDIDIIPIAIIDIEL